MDPKLYAEMQRKKQIPKNGRYNVNKMKPCDDALIFLVKQELQQKQINQKVQKNVVKMHVDHEMYKIDYKEKEAVVQAQERNKA